MVVGIDPGASGGIAVSDGTDPCARPMPGTTLDLLSYLQKWKGLPVFIEKVGASPQMGVVSAFKFGQSVGIIEACCLAAGLRIEYVTPQKWQKELGLKPTGHGIGQGGTEKKNRNKARAQELFPGLKITHAIADALLIAEYGRRQLRKESA